MTSTVLGPRDTGVKEADPFPLLTEPALYGGAAPSQGARPGRTNPSGCEGPVRKANGLGCRVTGPGLI